MSYTTIEVAQDGPCYVVTFNRPQRRNAVSLQMMDEIIDAARAAEADESVRW